MSVEESFKLQESDSDSDGGDGSDSSKAWSAGLGCDDF